MFDKSSNVTWAGVFITWIGSLSANEVAAYGGLLIGAAGLAANVYFKAQHLKLARSNAKRLVLDQPDD